MHNLKLGVATATLCATAISAAFASPYDQYTWCGEGTDNNWNTKANWVGGEVPQGYDFIIFPAGTNWVVNLPKTITSLGFWMPDGTGSLTFTGPGRLDGTAYGGETAKNRPSSRILVGTGRKLIIDGVPVTGRDYFHCGEVVIRNGGSISLVGNCSKRSIYEDGKLKIENGDFYTESNYFYVSNRAEVVLQSGTFEHAKGVSFLNESHYLQTGGRYIAHYPFYTVYTFEGDSTADILGGSVQWCDGKGNAANISSREFKKLLPKRGGRLDLVNANENCVANLWISPATTMSFGGVIAATNQTSANSGALYFAGNVSALVGGGTLYANCLQLLPSANDAKAPNWDLGALYLGKGGIYHDSHSADYYFTDGNVIGAFADTSLFSGIAQDSLHFHLDGPLSFKTANCFGDTNELGVVKTHSIVAKQIDLEKVTDLSAEGGGSVGLTIYDDKYPVQLRSIDIAANTTLALTNAFYQIKTMNLKMGANATLLIDLSSGGYIDAAAVAEFGAGAKIVVTGVPATLEQGRRYPIFLAPAKKVGSETYPTVQFACDLPEGWSLGTLDSSMFLTDGENIFPSYADNAYGWTGMGADNLFENADNWTHKPGSDTVFTLGGTAKPIIELGTANFGVGNLVTDTSAGPFVITGEPMAFAYPQDPSSGWMSIYYSLKHHGAFPFIFENDVANLKTKAIGLRFLSYNQGSISILGNSATPGVELFFGGDVRLGGSYTTSKVSCTPNYGAYYVTRRSSLTVMPGATLTVTAQTGSQDSSSSYAPRAFYYAVAKEGKMTVGGTDFTFARAATHFVDGELKVTCPFVTPVVQTFRGDGTLDLADVRGNADDFLGGLRLEGNLTFIPGTWAEKATLYLKDAVTIAPATDWTYEAATNLVLHGHSTLTFDVTKGDAMLKNPIVSSGDVAVTGFGRLVLGVAGTSLYSLTCANGATIDVSDALLDTADDYAFVDVLTVRRPLAANVFPKYLKVRSSYDVTTDSTTYSVRRADGMIFFIR